jgi:hypothetical protein
MADDAVCAINAAAHILNVTIDCTRSSSDRVEFDNIADVLSKTGKRKRDGEDFTNYNYIGFYHKEVLFTYLGKRNVHVIKIRSPDIISESVEKKLFLIDQCFSETRRVILFGATLITDEMGAVAENHWVVVINGVLLDGFFKSPKRLNVQVLERYTRIDSIYEVIQRSEI